ncbi:MAG: hypothetical protein FWG17_02925 [Desulfovibrionaceae bacterium]|nr:hypothetical protein [Desulfovibrionaceae bacterium]
MNSPNTAIRARQVAQGEAHSFIWVDMWKALKKAGHDPRKISVVDLDAFVKHYEREVVFMPLGPEDVPCQECNGVGELEFEVPLAVALRDIGVTINP